MESAWNPTESKSSYSGRNLLLIFFALSAGILIVGYFVYRNSEKNFRAEVDQQLSAIADLRVRDLELWRKERLGDGDVLFKNASITALVSDYLTQPGSRDARRQLLMWFGKDEKSYHYDRVWLLDVSGATRLTSPLGAEPAPSIISKRVNEILKSGQVVLQDFYRDGRDHRVYMGVLIPLYDQTPAHRPLGLIDLRIDPETYLYPYLKQWPGQSLTGETAILRREGDEAVLLNDSRFQKNTALNVRAPMTRTALPAVQALLGKEGVIDAIGYWGVPVVAALRTVPDSPWALVARRDTSEVYAPMRGRIEQLIAMMVVFLFAAGAGVGMIWRQQNSRLYQERAESLEERVALNIRYRQFFEATKDGVLILEASTGIILDVNPYLIELLGYPREEFTGKKIWNLAVFQKLVANRAAFALFANKDPADRERIKLETRDGRPIEAEYTCHGYRVKDQKLTQFNFQDITLHVRAWERQRFLNYILEQTADGVVVADLDLNIIQWNKGAEKIFGYTAPEILGKPGTVLNADEGPGNIAQKRQELSETGNTLHYEAVRKRKDGRLIHLDVSSTPLKNETGHIIGYSAIYRDVSEKLKALENRRLLASILEQTPDAVVAAGLDERIIQWNQGAERMFGYTSEEVLGKSMALLVPEHLTTEGAQGRKALMAGGKALAYETTRKKKDGTLIQVEISAGPLLDASGKIIGLSAIYRDITEQLKAQENQRLLAYILEQTPDGVVVADLDNNIIQWNQGAEKTFGYSAGEMLGKNVSLLVPAGLKGDFDQRYAAFLKGGAGIQFIETTRIRKDGQEIRVAVTVGPLRDLTGKIIGFSAIYRDITEQLKAQENQRFLVSILEQTPDTVAGVDLNGNISSWNRGAEAMFGYKLEEILGKPISILAPPGLEKEQKMIREAVLQDGEVRDLETIRLRKDGSPVDVSLTLSLIRDFTGKIVGNSGILRDISERKKSEETVRKHEDEMRLAQKMDAIGRLAGGVAHDFNNLLSVVSGNAEFIRRNLKEGYSPDEELEDILMAVQQGAELTKQLLVFSKKQVSQPQPIRLNQVCLEMNKMFKRLIDPRIEFDFIQDPEQKFIRSDQGQMQQVILNLVINARDAMPKGGKLTIETDHLTLDGSEPDPLNKMTPGPYVRLKVADTGTGMSPEIQQRIFEPFFTTKADKGNGLGLATVYAIVKNWGGTIFVHSVLGEGSTFTLYFPALDRVDQTKSEVKAAENIPMGSETILVAEDEGSFRKVLVRDLERHGYKVLQGGNGEEALEAASRYGETIDLLLTDTVMPKMNGKQLLDAVKKTRPQIKSIFLSGYAQELLSEQGILDSGIHLIHKPFSLDFLLRELRKVLDEK
jgi:PAS domain S-box-containing protein